MSTFSALRLLPLTLAFACAHAPMRGILNDADFTEVLPPSKTYVPGTFVSMKGYGGSRTMSILCVPSSAVGDAKELVSDTTTSELARKLTGSFQLAPKDLQLLKAKVGGKLIRNVTVSLSDTTIREIPAEEVMKRTKTYPLDACEQALEVNNRQGQRVGLLLAVFQSDLEYKVSFKAKASAEAQANLTEKIAAELRLDGGISGAGEIRGENLIFGVKSSNLYFYFDNWPVRSSHRSVSTVGNS